MAERLTAETQLSRVLDLVPRAARSGGVALAELARELEMEPAETLRELEAVDDARLLPPRGQRRRCAGADRLGAGERLHHGRVPPPPPPRPARGAGPRAGAAHPGRREPRACPPRPARPGGAPGGRAGQGPRAAARGHRGQPGRLPRGRPRAPGAGGARAALLRDRLPQARRPRARAPGGGPLRARRRRRSPLPGRPLPHATTRCASSAPTASWRRWLLAHRLHPPRRLRPAQRTSRGGRVFVIDRGRGGGGALLARASRAGSASRVRWRRAPTAASLVRYRVADPEWLLRHVLEHGPDAEVLGPPELRRRVREAVGRLLLG